MNASVLIDGLDLKTFMERNPHNTDCTDRFEKLVKIAYHMDKSGKSLEEFVGTCLYKYGGTVAGALVDFIYNNI